jgi:mono/diheme cytochrome c family protein
MKMKFRIIGSLAIAAVSTVILGSCAGDPDSAGLEYMPDMYRSPAIEPYVDYGHVRESENKDFKMSLSAMVPPNGAIPYYGTDSAEVAIMLPYKYKANKSFAQTHGMFGAELTDEDTYALAAADANPMALPTDEEELKAFYDGAKKLFNDNCSHCHGDKGDGNGEMMVNEKFAGVPDYANVEVSDGQMFYSIYYGKGAMGAHSSQLNKKEIWTLVHYIRKLQGKTGEATAEEGAEEAEAENAEENGEDNGEG